MAVDANGNTDSASNWQIIWYFLKPHKLQVIILLVLSLLVGGLEAALVVGVYPILTAALMK